MDPLSITGFVLAIGQCIGPIVNGIRALRQFKEIENSILASLEKSELFCKKLQIWLNRIRLLDETAISAEELDIFKQTLSEMRIATASLEAEVRYWLQALGINTSEREVQAGVALSNVSSSQASIVQIDVVEKASPTTILKFSRKRKAFSRLSRMLCFGKYSSDMSHASELDELNEEKKLKLHLEETTKVPKPHTSVARKAHFVVLGEHTVKNLTEKLMFWDDQLFSGYVTIAASANLSHAGMNKEDWQVLHPVARFIMEAEERLASEGNVTIIAPDVWENYYKDSKRMFPVDEKTKGITAFREIAFGHFEPKCATDDKGNKLDGYRSCVRINRGLADDAQKRASLKIAALFSGDQGGIEVSDKVREDGDMLRCAAMANVRGECCLLFKLPKGSRPCPMTLRSALDTRHSPRGFALHPISDRVKVATRLTTALFVLFSLGYVHKRINPERILLVESKEGGTADLFPNRLGYPYLVGFDLTRENIEPTILASNFAESQRRGIYFHFRDVDTHREHEYEMKDDIYSLGVCLFEIALWRSLFIWKGRDYVEDDSFVELSRDAERLAGLKGCDLGRARTEELIKAAEERIPGVLGHGFTTAVVACLKVHSIDNPFADHPRLKRTRNAPSRETVSDKAAVRLEQKKKQQMECLAYLELVLHHLQAVYRGIHDVAV